MSESGWVLLCLGLLTLCGMTITITLLLAARDVRRTLHRVNRSLDTAQRALTMVERGTRQVERVVARAADTAGGAMDRWAAWKEDAAAWFAGRVHNGTGLEPRRRHRRV